MNVFKIIILIIIIIIIILIIIIIIIIIDQNTEKGPGALSKLSVTQTPMENHHLTLMQRNVNCEKRISTLALLKN